MASFDCTSLGLWSGRPADIDDSVPVEKISIPNRQDIIYPGQQTPIIIPRAHQFLTNGHLVFDVNMTFPYQCPPVVQSFGTGQIGISNFIQGGNTLVAPYNSTNVPNYNIQTYMSNAAVTAITGNNVNINTYSRMVRSLAYGYPDYAIDPPRNLGHYVHLDRFVLEQSNGTIIYERSAATSWDGIITLALGTRTGAEFFAMDLMLGTGIAQNAPGIDPFLVPPPYTRGTRRANSIRIDGTGNARTITFTKEVNIPLPLPGLNSLPVQFMSDGDLNLQITFAANVQNALVAETQFYTGKLNLFQDSELSYAGNASVLSGPEAVIPSQGYQSTIGDNNPAHLNLPRMVPPIENMVIYPIIPNAPCADQTVAGTPGRPEVFPALTQSAGYEQSVLSLSINGVYLDTSDLSDILGAPELMDPEGIPNNPNLEDHQPSFPACSILNNGLLLKAKLSKMDIPLSSGYGNQPARDGVPNALAAGWETDFDYFYGHRLLRDMWISHYVHASEIADITLRFRHPISQANGDAQITAQGITISDNELGSKGKVYVRFASPQTINIPLYGYNGCNVAVCQDYVTNAPVYLKNLASCPHLDSYGAYGYQFGLFAQNFELDLVVSTNAWGFYGKTDNNQIPVIPKDGGFAANNSPVSFNATLWNSYSTAKTNALPNLPTFPVYMQPSSVSYTNLRVTFDKPKLSSKYIDSLKEMYEDVTTGLAITFVEMTRLVWPLQDQGFITWQTGPRQVYALRLGMRAAISPCPFGVRPYIPVTCFENYELTQGGVQVKVADPMWAAQCLGNCWPVQRPNLNSLTTAQPLGFLKGSGGNAYFQEQIDISIGNCFNRTDLSTGEPSFAVNMSYFNLVRGVWDIWYSMNTHGGAATIPVFTQWQLRYKLKNTMEYKMTFPVQILRNWTQDTYYPFTTDPFATGGYAAAQTYAVANQVVNAGNMGCWGYPQTINNVNAYSHYIWDMAAGVGTAGIGAQAVIPNQNGACPGGFVQPGANAPVGTVTYGFQQFKQYDDNVLYNESAQHNFNLEVQIYHRRRITFYQGKAANTGADIGLFTSTS